LETSAVPSVWSLATTAAIIAFALLITGERAPYDPARVLFNGQVTIVHAFIMGLLIGAFGMWVHRVRWHEIPIRTRIWFRMNRDKMWLMALGCVFAGVLVYY
jgi:hypothetical protein